MGGKFKPWHSASSRCLLYHVLVWATLEPAACTWHSSPLSVPPTLFQCEGRSPRQEMRRPRFSSRHAHLRALAGGSRAPSSSRACPAAPARPSRPAVPRAGRSARLPLCRSRRPRAGPSAPDLERGPPGLDAALPRPSGLGVPELLDPGLLAAWILATSIRRSARIPYAVVKCGVAQLRMMVMLTMMVAIDH